MVGGAKRPARWVSFDELASGTLATHAKLAAADGVELTMLVPVTGRSTAEVLGLLTECRRAGVKVDRLECREGRPGRLVLANGAVVKVLWQGRGRGLEGRDLEHR